MQEYHICHICGEKMYPIVESSTYEKNGHVVEIQDLHCFKCEICGERILESDEAKRVEEIVFAKIGERKN